MISDLFSQIRENNRQIETLLTLVDNLHYENRQLSRRIESRQTIERYRGETGPGRQRRGATGPEGRPRGETGPEGHERTRNRVEPVESLNETLNRGTRNLLSENRTEEDVVFYFYLPRRDEEQGLSTELISQETTRSLFNEIENPNNLSCPISLELFQPEQTVIMINQCRHIFNAEHLTRWFETKTTCPMCRRNIQSEPPLNRLANMASQMFSSAITTGVNDILNDLRI